MAFKYGCAIVSKIPNSFFDRLALPEDEKAEFIARAKVEHTKFATALQNVKLDVLELESEERHPDCAKVDDTAIVLNGTALMCNPDGNHRKGEVNLIRRTLNKELGVKIVELTVEDAKLEGSDVLFTGQELIVGISEHTNDAGAQAVARAFPEYSTTTVQVRPPFTFLKEAVSMAGVNVMAVSEHEAANRILKDITKAASFTYKVLTLPEVHAVNMLYVNHNLLHLQQHLIPGSVGVLDNKINYSRRSVELNTLQLAGLHLSQMALLVSKFDTQRNIVSTMH